MNTVSREELMDDFLTRHQWDDSDAYSIPGDASSRSYKRLKRSATQSIMPNTPRPHGIDQFITETHEHMILMNSPDDNVLPFVNIAQFLENHSLRAPHIYATDASHGLLLLEDFGNISLTSLLKNSSSLDVEKSAYKTAIHALIQLHNIAKEKLPHAPAYDLALLKKEVTLLLDYYFPQCDITLSATQKDRFHTIWDNLLPAVASTDENVLVLRDYHADNLMMINGKYDAVDHLGLLDFQDAVIGHPAYDLVSLIEDARRDALNSNQSWEHADELVDYFIQYSSINMTADTFKAHYAILGAQRNCKILGIFARLNKRDNKPHYLSYLPRVWHCLNHDLSHPALHELAQWFDENIPSSFRNSEAL